MVASPTYLNTSAGQAVQMSQPYTPQDTQGVVALSVAAAVSFTSVLISLSIMAVSAIKSTHTADRLVFVRTHVAAYFVSLLFSDLTQALGSLISTRWASENGVTFGVPCTAQGAIKNGGNVGTALWSLVIAIHTFFVLFLGIRPPEFTLYITLAGVWSLVGLIVVLGPAAIETSARGPYFGISGLWCWITDPYQDERLMMEYLWMFSSAFIGFILYVLVFFRLRGNIVITGRRIRLRRVTRAPEEQMTRNGLEAQVTNIAKQMLWYPVAYTILILPIAACRYAEWAGHNVPYEATIFSDFVFLLSGLVNTILFCSTRRVLPTSLNAGQWFSSTFTRSRSGSDPEKGAETGTASSSLGHNKNLSSSSNGSSLLQGSSWSGYQAVKGGPPPPLSPRSMGKVNAHFSPPPRVSPRLPSVQSFQQTPTSTVQVVSPTAHSHASADSLSSPPVAAVKLVSDSVAGPSLVHERAKGSVDERSMRSVESDSSSAPLTSSSKESRQFVWPLPPTGIPAALAAAAARRAAVLGRGTRKSWLASPGRR